MHQTWDHLLFAHWSVEADRLRRFVPPTLEIDTYNGQAWVSITPFSMRNVRPTFLPALPYLSSALELNVRTYVYHGRIPGVWFFSLDISRSLAAYLARSGYGLPYFRADMEMQRTIDGMISFTSHRRAPEGRPAWLTATWRPTGTPHTAPVGSLDFFLVERYCLYATRQGRLCRAFVHHEPWVISGAELQRWESTLFEQNGLDAPDAEPLVHAQREPLHVEVWAPTSV